MRSRGGRLRGGRHRRSSPESKSRPCATISTCTCWGISSTWPPRTWHAFLTEQRRQRIDRLRQMVARLAALGIALDVEAILRPAIDDPRKSAGRPWIARALVAGGHVANTNEAFDRWLAEGRPAFVPRLGRLALGSHLAYSRREGASLAGPSRRSSDTTSGLAASCLRASMRIEAYHSEHDSAATSRYLAMAASMGIAVSGGSDFHGDPTHGPAEPGAVCLPREAYDALVRLRDDPGDGLGCLDFFVEQYLEARERRASSPGSSR